VQQTNEQRVTILSFFRCKETKQR